LNLVITSDCNNIYNNYIILSVFNDDNKNIEFLKVLKIKYKLKEWISALCYVQDKDSFFVLNFYLKLCHNYKNMDEYNGYPFLKC
jgi:hypothetical protein